MLWKGATAASHAEGDDPMIFQDHRSDTHFQDETTFNRWCEDFLKRWNALCTQRGEFDVTPILIIDGAPQHKYHILLAAGVKIVQVPYKQTHVFQPADQWIIAMLRSLLFQGWSDWVEAIFAQNDVIHAVKLLVVNSAPAIRKKKFELFSAALRKVSANCVVDSWERTGILRELFGKVLCNNYRKRRPLLLFSNKSRKKMLSCSPSSPTPNCHAIICHKFLCYGISCHK